ncbi:ABC transporter permease subunit [Halobacillus kuroshimensis]|uniref:ABC transporter permease subunit n=1 Tax=Halobacillus kuroshimensis TaxID=302481 RepID=A0ABS3DRQ9_9BACI|nr:ABC transporter permease subunit [Halobacillus kuroshimensis]MBN8233933.1 ABC transporter permease subunit [Halobacillus kuroshimensis]
MTNARRWMVVIGSVYLLILLAASFSYTLLIEPGQADPKKLWLDENGDLKAVAPFPPSFSYPLGSDADGKSYFIKIIEGAKYTISLSVIIAMGRVCFSVAGGYLLFRLPSSIKQWFKGLSNALHYAPATIFTYVLITPVVLTFSWSYDLTTKIVFPCLVIIAVGVPVLSLYVQKEIDLAYRHEYIESARIMGAGKFRIFRRHLSPYLKPKLAVMFVQQIGQSLIIFAHLGLLSIFIGGSDTRVMEYDVKTGEAVTRSFSMSNEWAGMISENFQYFRPFPWMVLAPVTAFALTILAVNVIAYGLKGERPAERVKEQGIHDEQENASLDKEKFRMVK